MLAQRYFKPVGQTISLATNATGGIANTVQIPVTSWVPTVQIWQPILVRAMNNGASAVFLLFSLTGTAAAAPTPGTTTVGTPQPGFFIYPSTVGPEYFELPLQFQGSPVAIFVSSVSTGTSIAFDLVLGV